MPNAMCPKWSNGNILSGSNGINALIPFIHGDKREVILIFSSIKL